MTARGKYIVIEGGDGTGKTTQADILQEYLESQGKKVINLKEPGGSPVAEAIRSVIVDGTLPRTPMTNIRCGDVGHCNAQLLVNISVSRLRRRNERIGYYCNHRHIYRHTVYESRLRHYIECR